jgi:glycosyltransferase involved in cell wall biosynthesis
MAHREKKVVAVLPAYNAEKTLKATYDDIPKDWVDEILLVDDCSKDNTVALAHDLGIRVVVHQLNRGYGGNQKTCYRTAMDEMGADIMVMVHPDHQYDPTIIPHLVEPLQRGECDAVFGSRMLGGRPIEGGMPKWKYFASPSTTPASARTRAATWSRSTSRRTRTTSCSTPRSSRKAWRSTC